jgi:predicted nuclease with TOPRIM domain
MKTTENNQQLLQRFSKRIKQLSEEQGKLDESYERWLELDKQLTRLEGSVQAIEYLEYGKLPNDGNHTGMEDHAPR